MKISSPPPVIGVLTESINNGVKEVLELNCDQELYHWLTNNLLPSLAWLANDHLSSCVQMSETMANTVICHLTTLVSHIEAIAKFLRPPKDGVPSCKRQPGSEFISHKTRQMNILVYIITRQVLQLMANSMDALRIEAKGKTAELDPSTEEMEMHGKEVDLDISSSLVWLNDKDYQLCVTFTSKTESPIDNCVCTITNIDGTAGATTVRVTHYSMLEQTGLIHRIYFGTISPKQHRKILIDGKNVNNATFTVTIHDSVQRWKDNQKLQPRLISAIASRINVRDEDVNVIQILKSTEDDSECVVVLLRLFSPNARSQLRTLRKHQRCMDFQLLNVVDIREGMPPECMQLYGLPEMVVNVSSSVIQEAHYTETNCSSEAGYEEDLDNPSRRISFSALNKCEKNWVADIFLFDSLPVIDALVVQEELFRQEVYHLLCDMVVDTPRDAVDFKAVTDDIYALLETKYASITNSNFVKELLFQLSVHGGDYDELAYIARSIARQSHAGGQQELYSTAPKPAIYQQMVNLFMNVYILRHHLQLTLPEHTTQLQEEIVATEDDEDDERLDVEKAEQEERETLQSIPIDKIDDAYLKHIQPPSEPEVIKEETKVEQEELPAPRSRTPVQEDILHPLSDEVISSSRSSPSEGVPESPIVQPPAPTLPPSSSRPEDTEKVKEAAIPSEPPLLPVPEIPPLDLVPKPSPGEVHITTSLGSLTSPREAQATPTQAPSYEPERDNPSVLQPLPAASAFLPPAIQPDPTPSVQPSVKVDATPTVPDIPPLAISEIGRSQRTPVVPASPQTEDSSQPSNSPRTWDTLPSWDSPRTWDSPRSMDTPRTPDTLQTPDAPRHPDHPWALDSARADLIPYRRDAATRALAMLPSVLPPAAPTQPSPSPSPQPMPGITIASKVSTKVDETTSLSTPPATPPPMDHSNGHLMAPPGPPLEAVTPLPPSSNSISTTDAAVGRRKKSASPGKRPVEPSPTRTTLLREALQALPQRPVALQPKAPPTSPRPKPGAPVTPRKTRVALQLVQPTASADGHLSSSTTTIRYSPRPAVQSLGRPVVKVPSAVSRASITTTTTTSNPMRSTTTVTVGRVSPPKVFATQRTVTPRPRAASSGGQGSAAIRSRTVPSSKGDVYVPMSKHIVLTPRNPTPTSDPIGDDRPQQNHGIRPAEVRDASPEQKDTQEVEFKPPVVPPLALHFLSLSPADLQPPKRQPASAPCSARSNVSYARLAVRPNNTSPSSPRGDVSRAEMMKQRHEMTRERVRLREIELKRKAEAQIAAKFSAPKNVPLPEYLKKEKKRRDDLLEQKTRCSELHALLKNGAFAWLPAQPPPPPPIFRDGMCPSRTAILDIDD